MSKQQINRPSAAFIASAWTALLLGAVAYLVGLFNAEMLLNEKGYYLTLLLFGLFSAVSLQKSVRDRLCCARCCCCWWGCGTRPCC